MQIHVVRHTQPDIAAGICYGQANIDLVPEYPQAFQQLALEDTYDAVFSSPLIRCTRMADYFGFPYLQDDRLMELNFGDWELQKWEEIPPQEIQPWYDNYYVVRPPNGENFEDLKQRVLDFWNDLQLAYPNKKVLIFTHVGVIRMLRYLVYATPITTFFDEKISFGAVVKIHTTPTT